MTNETIEKNCPDPRVLVDFLQGKLVPPELENCESHLEGCDACQETLSGINASDTLSDVVAKAMGPHAPSTDDAEVVQNLVRRLGKPTGFANTRSDNCNKELLRDRAAEVLLHVASDPEDDDSLGLLAGFRLRELLGAGGTGVVFRAYDLALNREIALKVLRPSLGDLARDRFVAEARAAASIDHENVVAIHQVGEQKRLAWIAMKWVPGETLESRLVREGSLGEFEVRQLSVQIAKGLAEAHRQQLVHRDIKPANVWIGDADGKVLILDFGLVRITDNDPALTATGMLAGTPNFMSPEQAKGQELDARSDLFSLGCVMYQMITGTLPFGSPTILATLQSIQTQQPDPPNLFADDCSDELSDLTMALLEKKPANRVDSAESLVHCLETPRCDWSADVKRRMAAKREQTERALKPLATPKGSRFGAGSLFGAILLGLFGFGLWFFSPQIIRIATNQGELVIETDDENVEVTVSQDGDVRVLDTDSGASFDVRSGEIAISAVGKDGQTEFDVSRNQLTMKRGGREVVQVTQTPKENPSGSQTIEKLTEHALNQTNLPEGLFGDKDKEFIDWLEIDSQTIELIRGAQSNAFVAYSKSSQTWSAHKFAEYLTIQPITLGESFEKKHDLVVGFEYGGGPVTELAAIDCKGQFRVHKLNQALNCELKPVLNGDGVIYYINDEIVYAFSGKTGTWDTVKVPGLPNVDWRNGVGHVPSIKEHGFDTETEKGIVIKLTNGTAIFLAETGGWQRVPKQGEPQRVFQGHNFGKWLQIVKTEKQADVKAQAIAACCSLIESDLQFNQIAKLLGELAQSQPLFRTAKDGSVRSVQHKTSNNIFLQGYSNLSADQAIEFLELQLKDGSDQAVINTLLALDEWGDVKNNSEKELLHELKPNAPELLRLANLRKQPQPVAFTKFFSVLESMSDQSTKAKANDQEAELYKGKQLSEWLKVLEIDQDPPTQGTAVKACATLYESRGQTDEIVDLLKSYIKRHASNKNFLQDTDQYACFSGFAESLEKLPPKTVVEFLKFQLKQGNEFAIGWAYMGLLKPRDLRKFSIFTRFKPYSPELEKELKLNVVELLRLIADHDKVDSLDYLLVFIVDNLLEGRPSEDAINAIRAVVIKFEPIELLKAANKVPKAVLDKELFASVKTRLLAADTSTAERDELISSLIKFEKKAKAKATFILEILAEVTANQLYASGRVEFDEFQIMKVYAAKEPSKSGESYKATGFFVPKGSEKLEIKGNAVVARKLLSEICERLLDQDITTPAKIAKQVLVILSEASSNNKAADPTELEHFNQLEIAFDLEELKKLSNTQSGEFSGFIGGNQKF